MWLESASVSHHCDSCEHTWRTSPWPLGNLIDHLLNTSRKFPDLIISRGLERAQKLRVLTAPPEDARVISQHPHGGLQPPLTPVPEDRSRRAKLWSDLPVQE